MNLAQAIQDLFTDIRDVAQIIAPIAAVIGFLGLGILYLGSSWPIIGDWKKDNPKAANKASAAYRSSACCWAASSAA
jgi:phage-related minor tail protein